VATKAVGALDVRSSALTGLVDYDGFSAPTPGRGGARLDGVAQSLRECGAAAVPACPCALLRVAGRGAARREGAGRGLGGPICDLSRRCGARWGARQGLLRARDPPA